MRPTTLVVNNNRRPGRIESDGPGRWRRDVGLAVLVLVAIAGPSWGQTHQELAKATRNPVADDNYQPPFRFTGTLHKLTLTVDRPERSPKDIKKLEAAMHNNQSRD